MILTIARKELKALFASPLAWITLTAVQIIAGFAFLKRLDDFLQVQPNLVQLASPPGVTELVAAPLFNMVAIVMIFAAPLLGMRLIAEERRQGTMVLLTSAPASATQIVLGKFAGLVFFLAIVIGLIAVMPLSLARSTQLDYGMMASLAFGLVLLAAGFAAVSLYVSSLTTHPMGAAFGAFTLLLLMAIAAEAAGDGIRTRGWHLPGALVQVFSPLKNFEPLDKGLIDTYAIVCSLLFAAFFLVLTIRRLEARRLRG